MKANIHPDYHPITVVMTDGETYETFSTWGKAGDTLRLDVDSKSHPVYTGGSQRVVEKGQLSKFENRYGSFLSGNSEGNAPKAQEKSKDK